MTSWYLLPLGLVVDYVLGDPALSWHPVKLMGQWATRVEATLRPFGCSRIHGMASWLTVLAPILTLAQLVLLLARAIHPWAEQLVAVAILYFSIAPRDLARHAERVFSALQSTDVTVARAQVGFLVGRDTEVLDGDGVARAAVEAVAESTVDGVTAPLFWFFLLGPLGALGYRAINTLDSMWGHHDDRYETFGWAAARSDDVANWLPARVTVPVIALSAAVLRLRPWDAVRAALRDGPKHQSPNSGLAEAAFAGALSVTLGGANRYDGHWSEGPQFGIVEAPATLGTLRSALRLMWVTTWLSAGLFCGANLLLREFF